MADAWTNLLAKSSLPSSGFDAWEHLISIKTGTGLSVVKGLEIEMDSLCFEVFLNEELDIYLELLEFDIELFEYNYEIEVCI